MPEVDLGNVMGPQGLPGSPGADGQDGRQGDQGEPGKDASINGVNALQIDVGTGLNASMNGNTYSISMEDETYQAAQRAAAGGALDQAIEQKAPAGFGLGENYTTGPFMPQITADTIDTTLTNGWYFANGVDIAGNNQAVVRVDSTGRTITQTAYIALKDYVLKRCLPNTLGTDPANKFSPWEWVNPPIQPGVEYRTTERYLEKPVYVKLVDCGAGPNATEKRIAHNAANAIVIDFGGVMQYGSGGLSIPWIRASTLSVSSSEIVIATTANYSAYTAKVWIKYYKTTD